MKKLIAILGAVGFTTTTASVLVSCGPKEVNKQSDIQKIFESAEGKIKIKNEENDEQTTSSEGFPVFYYIFSRWPKFSEETKFKNYSDENENINEWKETQKFIKDNQEDWDLYLKDWFDDGKFSYIEDEQNFSVEIIGFNNKIKENLKNSLKTLLDEDIILIFNVPEENENPSIRIYSENKDKYESEYSKKLILE
ncbi:lipoprotein [Mesoplasma florum]|uniref:lipoprotein n=1 Tax=Mesoplasma florum TaxID=2151 RepID=UPI000BE2F3AD|nr:lipoprotein [Mesoplasma florum]ATI74131.1 hypothetical protein CQZ70_02640 [Mesoplasma florum]